MSGQSLTERFWTKVDRAPGVGCWTWTAARISTGYGEFYALGKMALAHRVAYELEVGPIPEGLQLDHLCRNRLCVRPDHLEPVTQAENIARGNGASARAARRTACVRGHVFVGLDRRGYRTCGECPRAERPIAPLPVAA